MLLPDDCLATEFITEFVIEFEFQEIDCCRLFGMPNPSPNESAILLLLLLLLLLLPLLPLLPLPLLLLLNVN